MLLEKSERFVKEYTEFSEKISQIKSESVKADLVNLLNQLMREVKEIDKRHRDIMSGIRLPSGSTDSRQNIVELRKRIYYKLQECEKAGMFKV